jgi:hypothetical protein
MSDEQMAQIASSKGLALTAQAAAAMAAPTKASKDYNKQILESLKSTWKM